jgi:demethylmenaquinone methyltransferase / 2-methoxy-6-polyprenyl-1,4-benzoquinol methylase
VTLQPERVREMFDRISPSYDRMNMLMSGGRDGRWRRLAVRAAAVRPGDSAIDVCCGTGDLAVELRRAVGPSGRVVGLDFAPQMLDVARRKSVAVEWVEGDALALPFQDDEFAAATVGFGVRNLADLDRGLREMARVLKPGGRLVILEITQPTRPPLSTFFSLWFDRLVPLLGSLSDEPEAYSYLPESVRSFPSPHGLAEKMDRAGFTAIHYTVLAGGIIAIHSGAKRPQAV